MKILRTDLTQFIERLPSFFLGSLAGVSIDLTAFQLLVISGLTPFFCNIISAGLGITTTYMLVTRYTFGLTASARSFTIFLLWYAFSITTFSALIALADTLTVFPPIVCKFGSLPFSFSINYLFSNFFLGRIKND